MEVYVLIPVRKSFATVFMAVLSMVLALLSLLLTCAGVQVFAALVVIFGVLWYFFAFRSNKEFEYSYFDGDVRFAKVMNKSRRKSLGSCSMEEVIQIAPAHDSSVHRYEEDKTIRVKDYTSHTQKDYYVMIIQKAGNTSLIKFEPDEKYLDAIEIKYRQKLVRRQG